MTKAKSGRARMPWDGDIAHTKLSDGTVVLRGSKEDAVDKFGDDDPISFCDYGDCIIEGPHNHD